MEIIPYVEFQGAWSLDDSVIVGIWHKMKSQNLTDTVFYGGEIHDSFSFVSMFRNKANLVNVVVNDSNPVALSWLNEFGPNYAKGHFCFFADVWGNKTDEIGDMILDYWFDIPADLDVIIGQVPAHNRRAIEFVKRIGFTELGTIPMLGHGIDPHKRVGDTLLYLTRGQHGKGEQR